jgi:hypothetical protein
MEGVELRSFSCARCKRALRPMPGAKRWASFRRTNDSRLGGVSLFAAHLQTLDSSIMLPYSPPL